MNKIGVGMATIIAIILILGICRVVGDYHQKIIDKQYQDGYDAGKEGIPAQACPYGYEREEKREQWMRGWGNGWKTRRESLPPSQVPEDIHEECK